MLIADLDGDGLEDLLYASAVDDDITIKFLLNITQPGNPGDVPTFRNPVDGIHVDFGLTYGIITGRLSGTDLTDILMSYSGRIIVMTNVTATRGVPIFEKNTVISFDGGGIFPMPEIADINQDGFADVIFQDAAGISALLGVSR